MFIPFASCGPVGGTEVTERPVDCFGRAAIVPSPLKLRIIRAARKRKLLTRDLKGGCVYGTALVGTPGRGTAKLYRREPPRGTQADMRR
jgi:hypothetical protein